MTKKYNLFATYRDFKTDPHFEYKYLKALTPCVEYYSGDDFVIEKSTGKIITIGTYAEKAKEAIMYAQRIIDRLVLMYPNKYMTRDDYLNSSDYKKNNMTHNYPKNNKSKPTLIPNNIKAMLNLTGKTQMELASDMGVAQTRINDYCKGIHLTPTVLRKLCRVFSCEKSDLVNKQYWDELPLYEQNDKVEFYIKEAIALSDVSKQELANELNISPKTIDKYISHTIKIIPQKKLRQMAKVMGCDVKTLYELVM